MEAVLAHAVQAQLKAFPPTNAIDVIRAAKLVTQGCHVDTPTIVHVLTIVARGQDGIEGTPDDIISVDIMKKLRTLLMNDMVEDLLDEIRVVSRASKCFCC